MLLADGSAAGVGTEEGRLAGCVLSASCEWMIAFMQAPFVFSRFYPAAKPLRTMARLQARSSLSLQSKSTADVDDRNDSLCCIAL